MNNELQIVRPQPDERVEKALQDYDNGLALASLEDWLLEPGRSKAFQAFLDSLESRAVKRAKAQESKPVRPVFGNYATKRG